MSQRHIDTYTCPQECCKIEIARCEITKSTLAKIYTQKAGVFIYDPEQEKVLLVQSRGHLWGMPKGTVETEKNETNLECAIRETQEETGIKLTVKDFTRATKVKNRAMYYYAEKKSSDIHIQENPTEPENDANGITWIKISCLYDCVNKGQIVLNQHSRIVFKRFLNIEFPDIRFTLVERKKKKRSDNK